METRRGSRTGAAGLRSGMGRRQDVPAPLGPPIVLPAEAHLDVGQGEERLAADPQDRRRAAVDCDPGGLLLILRAAGPGRADQRPGGADRPAFAAKRQVNRGVWPCYRHAEFLARPSCLKSRKSDSETPTGRETRESGAAIRGSAPLNLPEITHPRCPKSRRQAAELPEITKQNRVHPQNHVARFSTATRFSVNLDRNAGANRLESASAGQYVILGRTTKNRDLRQKWQP